MKEVRGQKSGIGIQKVAAGFSLRFQRNLKVAAIGLLLTLFFTSGVVHSETQNPKSKIIKVAILPWKINAEEGLQYLKGAANDMLASRIGSESSFEIVKESSLKSAMSKYGSEQITEEIAKDIGKEAGADYVVYGSLTVIANNVSVDLRIVAVTKVVPSGSFAKQGKGMESIVSLIDETAKDIKAKISDVERISKEKPAEPSANDDFIVAEKSHAKGIWKSPQFDTAIKCIDIADIDGDGKNEIIMLDDHNLFIYRLNGQTFEKIKEFRGDVSVKNYNVSIADINNNGMPEIYVTRMINDRLNSYMVEYKDGDFKIIASDLKWFMKVEKDPMAGPTLMGQRYNGETGFYGRVEKLEWKDGKLQETGHVDMPDGLNLYNFTMADLNKDGAVEVIALDARDYLHVYKKDKAGIWKEIWKSGEFYGGSLNRLELGASTAHEASDFVDIKSRIVFADTDGDGPGEVIIARNDPGLMGRYLKTVGSYDRGEIIDLSWRGTGLEENWRTKKIDGYIADYAMKDIDNDGQKELVISIVMEGGRGKSYIMSYKMNPVRSSP